MKNPIAGHTSSGDGMKYWKGKLLLCGFLMLFAALSVITVLGDMGVLSASDGESAYILREHEGYVNVFYPGEDLPAMATDIRVRDLPAGDRRQLEEGISAENHQQMLEILEGLSS